jgi:uncharacterized membrane protein
MDDTNNNVKGNRILFPSKLKKKSIAFKISIGAMMTALNSVVTVVFAISIPTSEGGYFNIGESAVYLTAILFGPYIGAIASGFGAFFADLFLNAAIFAPGSLIIKGLEGFLVGFVYYRLVDRLDASKQDSKKIKIKILTLHIIISIIITCGIIIIGLMSFMGDANFFRIFADIYLFNVKFTYIFWAIIGVLTLAALLVLQFFYDKTITSKILSMLCGGSIIILGYFLYEIPIIGISAAYIEIPFNFMQIFLGIAIAIPISSPIMRNLSFYNRFLPYLKENMK